MTRADIPAVSRILAGLYRRSDAPVVRMERARTRDPFRILVTTILSARTQDATTIAAAERLFGVIRQPGELAALSVPAIEKLIHPVGFYHTKARHLRALPTALTALFGGRVPDTLEDLCRLPGVGRKTANLVVTAAFDKPGICVDVHVHRICNRLGLLRTRTPAETETALRALLPRRYWKTWNPRLVSFGQTVCRPIGPRCSACPIRAWCARVGI